jgi:hypothetical protein
LLTSLTMIVLLGAPMGRADADVIYRFPRVGGAILDHCWTWAQNCGWTAANWYCRRRGHPRARSFGRYRPGRTYVAGSRRYCNGGGCTGYNHIRCVSGAAGPGGPGGRVRTFSYPRIRGAILDHCWTWATNCGWARANWFCRVRGYRRAIAFNRYRPGRTYVVGSNRYCRGTGCVGFRSIRCRR